MSADSIFAVLDAVGYEAGRLLLTLLWQSSIVFLVAWVLLQLLRNARAAVRFGIIITAVLTVPILPVFSRLSSVFDTPKHELNIIPRYQKASDRTTPDNKSTEPETTESVPPIETASDDNALSGSSSTNISTESNETLPSVPATESSTETISSFSLLDYPWAIALLLYGLIAGWFLFWFAGGRVCLGIWLKSSRSMIDNRVIRYIEEASNRLGIRRPVIAIECDSISAPMTYRVQRPIIMFPSEFATLLSDEELHAVIVHECAHIKRQDALLLTLTTIIRALFFMHPLVWIAAHHASILSERACDEIVVDNALDAAPYAELLTRIASRLPAQQLPIELAAGFIISRDTFFKRVEAILNYGRRRFKNLPRWAAVLTVLTGMLAVIGAVALPLAEKDIIDPYSMKDSYKLHGWVLHNGKAVPGALIYIDSSKFDEYPDSYHVLGATDAHGRFTVKLRKKDVLPINFDPRLIAFHPDYGVAKIDINASSIATGFSFLLPELRCYRFKVVDTNGNPLPGLQFSAGKMAIPAKSITDNWNIGVLRKRKNIPTLNAITDENGMGFIDNIPVDGGSVIFQSADYVTDGVSDGTWNNSADKESYRLITMRPASTLSGILLDGSGKPVGGFSLTLRSMDSFAPQNTTTDVDGRFSFGGLQADNCYLLPGVNETPREWDLRPDFTLEVNKDEHVTDVVRRLEPTRVITGTVIDEESGEPVPDCIIRVNASRPYFFSEIKRIISGVDGTFSTKVPSCEISLTVSPPFGYSDVHSQKKITKINEDKQTGSEEYLITLQRGSIIKGKLYLLKANRSLMQ